MHCYDIGGNHSRISSIHHDAPFPDAGSQINRKQGQSQFRIAINRNTPEAPSPAAEKEVRKIEMSDSISTRHHIHDTASFSHQRKKFARQQIRGHIVDAYRTLQAILCDAALRLHCPRIVHQQTDGIAAFQKNFGKRRHRCK